MAIQGNMKYIGTVDGVIHYCSKGEYYLRTVPDEEKLPVTSSLGSIITCTVALQFCKSFNHYAIPVSNLKYLPVIGKGVWNQLLQSFR
jgi:hypothetical protein